MQSTYTRVAHKVPYPTKFTFILNYTRPPTTDAIFELWLSTYYEKDKYYTAAAATVQPYNNNNNNSSNWNRHSVYSIDT